MLDLGMLPRSEMEDAMEYVVCFPPQENILRARPSLRQSSAGGGGGDVARSSSTHTFFIFFSRATSDLLIKRRLNFDAHTNMHTVYTLRHWCRGMCFFSFIIFLFFL